MNSGGHPGRLREAKGRKKNSHQRTTKAHREYLAFGAEYICVIDPEERRTLVYSQQTPAGRVEEALRTQDPDIEIPLTSVLPAPNPQTEHLSKG